MRVFDRYAGEETDLPSIVDPGRYRLLAVTRLNGDIEVQAGSLLLSDGRDRCNLEGNPESVFRAAEGSEEEATEIDLVDRSLTALALRLRSAMEEDLSPLIPAELGELADLNDLEKTLDFVIERGHLDEIARRPRFGMHYEAEVAPLSRARRMAPNVESYLASHPEDWHRRTLSGVLPKRILALFSEDDWAIYENRVFARLLDRLDAHLRFRLREVEKLHEKYQDARNLSNAETLYFRLREKLCTLWGQALSPADTKILLERSDSALRILRRLMRKVGSLRQSDLYKRIPRNARVPDQIRHTNILDHDQHYRHLAGLWHLHQVQAVEIAKTPPEIHTRNQQLHADYVAYLGMMLRRVLRDMGASIRDGNDASGAFLFAGKLGQLVQDKHEWKLTYAEASLLIIPGLFPVVDLREFSYSSETRVPVYCYSVGSERNTDKLTAAGVSEGPLIVVNPLEFYGLERLRALIERFVWKPILVDYGERLPSLPKEAATWLHVHGITSVVADRISILRPLSSDIRRTFTDWLAVSSINEKTRTDLRRRIDGLDALSKCKHCGQSADFESRGLDFLASCRDCRVEWGVYSAAGKRQARFGVIGEQSPTFASHGAWNLEIPLSERPAARHT